MKGDMTGVMDLLQDIREDNTIPKNVRVKINDCISNLKVQCDYDIKVSRLLTDLEEVSDDPNLPSYTRTEILSIISILEEI